MTERSGPPDTRRGYEFGEVTSALQKSIRRGQEDAAVYWAAELDRSGFCEYVWRRLKIIASEDVGLADPLAVVQVRALYENWQDERKRDRKAEGGLFLVHAVLILARARKSRIADSALIVHYSNREPPREVPDVALDRHTRRGRRMGRGWAHFFEDAGLLADLETGELTADGTLPDPYRERAIAILANVAKPQPAPERAQMELDPEEER